MVSIWSLQFYKQLHRLKRELKSHPELWSDVSRETGLALQTIRGIAGKNKSYQNPTLHTLTSIADAYFKLLAEVNADDTFRPEEYSEHPSRHARKSVLGQLEI